MAFQQKLEVIEMNKKFGDKDIAYYKDCVKYLENRLKMCEGRLKHYREIGKKDKKHSSELRMWR